MRSYTGKKLLGVRLDTLICMLSYDPYEQREAEANAHLIAVAPDLLDACKESKRGDMLSDASIILEEKGHPQLAAALRRLRDLQAAVVARAEG